MRVPAAALVALLAVSSAVLAGCTSKTPDTGRLQIVMLIPENLFDYGFEELTATIVNITAADSQRREHEWEPAQAGLRFRAGRDEVILNDQVPAAIYKTFDFWVEDVEGVFENGTRVTFRTEAFGGTQGKLSTEFKQETQVVVEAGGEITFLAQTAVAQQGDEWVWG